ncbi:hypothetical protein ACFS7Z_24885 [Pontibacter toksunensis]|uniref:Uncharacterized protein n=1 Tax=Pontibacter toksunensis TaxID=1332631 RepID=A0ABW6C187_9BACT
MNEDFDKFLQIVKQNPKEANTAFLVKCVRKFWSLDEEEYTDEEIGIVCSNWIESVVCMVRDTISPSIISKKLGNKIEEQLISSLLDKAKWYAWYNIATLGGIHGDFFKRLGEYVKKFEAKVTSIWFQKIEYSIRQSDAKEALRYINEMMFQVKSVERRHDLLRARIPEDLPHLKGFFSDCFEYLSTRIELETIPTDNSCKTGNVNILIDGTRGTTGTSGTKIVEHKALFDIWEPGADGKKDYYYKVVERLKSDHHLIGALVSEQGGKLYWNRQVRGSIQYLAGLIYMLTKHAWIAGWHNAPFYKRVLERTFNITFSAEPLKALHKFPPANEYLEPFLFLEINLK